MHNIKDIRNDPKKFKVSLKKRFLDVDLENLLDLDQKNRKLIQEKETLEKEKKEISKTKNKDLFEKSKTISQKIETLEKDQKITKNKLENILSSLPNIPNDDVPVGKDENSNLEISKNGTIPKFDFKPKSHFELGENLKMLDFELAAKTTGSRFVFVKDKLALLERAISNFMLDIHIDQNGYQEISPPLIASESTMYGTGQLPKFENDQFEINFDEKEERKFLFFRYRNFLTTPTFIKLQLAIKCYPRSIPQNITLTTGIYSSRKASCSDLFVIKIKTSVTILH